MLGLITSCIILSRSWAANVVEIWNKSGFLCDFYLTLHWFKLPAGPRAFLQSGTANLQYLHVTATITEYGQNTVCER